MSDVHEEHEAQFSDLHEGALAEPARSQLLAHLEACPACKEAYAEFQETMRVLDAAKTRSTAGAPEAFGREVEDTIHRRSAGRFFGKKTLGDRVPFGVLLIIALVVLVATALVLWSSVTGSMAS